MAQQFASDYIDVAQRIADFREKHPEGSLQPANPEKPFEVLNIEGQTFIAYTAAAYRTPDDARPGIGVAYEQFPGKSNFTRGSELQNAETSAWGRAIVAALAGDTKKSIASAEEVRNRQADRQAPQPADPIAEAKRKLWQAAKKLDWDAELLAQDFARAHDGLPLSEASAEQMAAYTSVLEGTP